MKCQTRSIMVCNVLLFFTFVLPSAAVVPISVFPDPVQFGVVPENTSSNPVPVFISNLTSSSAVITGMSIAGTNKANFAFNGPPCVGTISGGQTCEMSMIFTPPSISNFSASLAISVQGLTQAITIPLEGAGGNPLPSITSLSPPGAYVNSPGFVLTVNGTAFVSGAVVFWNSTALPTAYVSATKLTAQVPAVDLGNLGSNFVSVSNPSPGGGFSATVNFNVVALDPTLNSASPSSLVAGTGSTAVIVNGNNFMIGSKVLWNGNALPTTYINSGELQVQPGIGMLATPDIVQLAVSNPSPGGISTPLFFNVTYPAKVTILDIPANDLVWDPYAQRIYASVPSSYGENGNTIAVINPLNNATTYHFAGSEPNQLALSSDSRYLYVGLNGNGSVKRFLLPTFTPDIDVSLGSSQFSGLNTASSLQVSPGNPHTFAVAEGASQCCASPGLFFFTDSTKLANSITNIPITDIVFASPTTLYAYDDGTVSQIAVSSSGGSLVMQWNGLVTGSDIQYAAGLIYGNGGEVLDPANGFLVGTYEMDTTCCIINQLLPESPINHVFIVGQTGFSLGAFGITSYNLSQFAPVAVANLSQLSGSAIPSLIKWGNSGLAFILQSGCCGTTTNQVVLVQSGLMLLTISRTPNSIPVAHSLSPSSKQHGGGNFPLMVQGTGFVPGSRVTWNGVALDADYLSSTQLKVYVPASDIASAGTANVVVINPAPGGGTSTALKFTID